MRLDLRDAYIASITNIGEQNGRALFVDISGDRVEVENYDAHNGPRCAEHALAGLIAQKAMREGENDVSAIAAMAGLSR